MVDYRFRLGANCGGAYGQVFDLEGDEGKLIGDMWGAVQTRDGGKTWQATNQGAPSIPSGRALALSKRPATKGWAFAGIGVSHNSTPGSGYFGVISPAGKIRQVSRSPRGFGLNIDNANGIQPRPAGSTIVPIYDSVLDREYVYACAPTGIVRYMNDGAHPLESSGLALVEILSLDQCWKAAVALDADHLMLATFPKNSNGQTQTPKVYALSGIRGSNAAIREIKSGIAVNALRWVGGKLYAAATQGLYRIDNPLGQTPTFTKLGGTFFDRMVTDVCGTGSTLFVGQADGGNNMPTGHAVAKSTDGGATWKYTAGNVSKNLYGTNDVWWLSTRYPNGGIQGNGMDVSQMIYTNGVVWVCGRRGAWASPDQGATWYPAVRGMGGVVNRRIALGSFGVNVDDEDWGAAESGDKFRTCKQAQPRAYPAAAKSRSVGGHTYQLVEGAPYDIRRDGQSIADDVFRGWATSGNVEDLAVASDGTIYVASSGGATLVGDPL